jgi:hypothetical protein
MTERKTTSTAAKGNDKATDEEDSSRLDNDGAPAQLSRAEAAELTRQKSAREGKDAPHSPDRDVTSATKDDPDKTPPQGSDNKRQRVDKDKEKAPLQKRQEGDEEIRNRKQPTSPETPAGDPSPHPQASATANMVDMPGRAHTLSYDEDEGRAVALGERLQAAQETEQLEVRPKTHPGISTDDPKARYSVELELRAQWPGIKLGDDVEPEEASAADKK